MDRAKSVPPEVVSPQWDSEDPPPPSSGSHAHFRVDNQALAGVVNGEGKSDHQAVIESQIRLHEAFTGKHWFPFRLEDPFVHWRERKFNKAADHLAGLVHRHEGSDLEWYKKATWASFVRRHQAGEINNLSFTSDGSMRGAQLSWACILWDRDFVDEKPRYRAVYGRAGVAPGSSAFDAEAEALWQAVQLFMELITGKICDGWCGWQADGVKCLDGDLPGSLS